MIKILMENAIAERNTFNIYEFGNVSKKTLDFSLNLSYQLSVLF